MKGAEQDGEVAGTGVEKSPGDDGGGSGEGEFKNLVWAAGRGLVDTDGGLGVAGWDDYIYEVGTGKEGRGRGEGRRRRAWRGGGGTRT